MPRLDNGPAYEAVAMTTDTDLPPFRGIYVSVAGNATIRGLNGVDATFQNLIAGVVYPFAGTRIVAATTTATLILLR